MHTYPNTRDIFWSEKDEAGFENVRSNFEGTVAIITGGGKGIGRAIAEKLLAQGAKVAIFTRTSGKDLAEAHENCTHHTCDVRDCNVVKAAVKDVLAMHGKIDMVFNCAGYAYLTDFAKEDEALFDEIIDINFKGMRHVMRHTVEELRKTSGHVVNFASIWGFPGVNLPGDATYSAGDAAILKLSEVVAAELPDIHVNCISPALVETAMNDDMTEEHKAEFIEAYPERDTLIQPQEIADIALEIVSLNATGKSFVFDGGYLKRVKKS